MILNENESGQIFEPDNPMDAAIFNFAYRLYLDGTYAASEKERDKVVKKFAAYIEQRSTKEKFFLICDLFDQLHAIDLANHELINEADHCGTHGVTAAATEGELTTRLSNFAHALGWRIDWTNGATAGTRTASLSVLPEPEVPQA